MSIISVKHVSKEYKLQAQASGPDYSEVLFVRPSRKRIQAVKDMSFDIEQGDFVGFIGENGAGKSTMIKMMSGILYPTSGEIITSGIIPYKKRKENAMNIGVVFGQRSRLVWELPMTDTFALYKEIYRIPRETFQKNVKLFVEMLNMGDYFQTPIRQLSLGQRMRVEIALSMLHEPPILFLDEPTIGLDVVAKKHIRDFFKERNSRDGTTIVLTSHDMKDLDTIAKRIIMITKGELLFNGTIDELKERYTMESIAVFSFSGQIDKNAAQEFGEVSADRYKLSITFDPKLRKLPEVINTVGSLGEISNIEVKSADIEDLVRKVYS